jgi:type VI secretion system secreted protein Hcp
MAFNIHLDVPDAPGESKKAGKAKQIEVISWKWGMTKSGDSAMSAGTAGRVDVHDVEVLKYIDNSSGYLMKFCCMGKPLPEVTLSMDKATDKTLEFVKLVLKRCVVSGIETGGEAIGERLTETVKLRFGAFAFTYVGQGESDASADFAWDVEANEPC